MRFTVDPWDPAYGASTETDLDETRASVATDVERRSADWAPVQPAPRTLPGTVVFVDGVRRLEARTWIDDEHGDVNAGIFASYAAGAVVCDARARLGEVRIGRGVYAPAATVADVETRAGVFTAHRTADSRVESLMYAVHLEMADAEVRVAEATRRDTDALLLLDGPLRSRGHIPDAVGLVKTHQVRYLPPDLDLVVAALEAGTRTPVFRVDAQPFSRYSWYTRLPGPSGGPWAGVVRCEATGALAPAAVTELADTVTSTIGRFASAPHKDPRAPQNLYPIGGLERELRRRLGDPLLLYRALRRASVAA